MRLLRPVPFFSLPTTVWLLALFLLACEPQQGGHSIREPKPVARPVVSYAAQWPAYGCGVWARELTASLCSVLGKKGWREFNSQYGYVVLKITMRRAPTGDNVGIPKEATILRATHLLPAQRSKIEASLVKQAMGQVYEMPRGSGPALEMESVTLLYNAKRYTQCPPCLQ